MKQKNETKIKENKRENKRENKSEKKIKKEKKKYKNTSIANHKYLQYTNLLLIISIFYFLFSKPKLNEKHKIEYLLSLFLIITIIFSQLFWNNPIKQSKIHRIDAIIAKITIFSFILYTIIYKFKFTYLFVLLAISISFYFSNYFSNQEWCSNKHLVCHGCLHIFCFIATFYAFTPFAPINPILL
jgi:hypothetical protein